MKSRILVAAVGIPALLYVVLAAPPWVMMAALCLLAGIGGMELQRCVGGVKRGELVSVTAPPGDPSHIQSPTPDAVVDMEKCLL